MEMMYLGVKSLDWGDEVNEFRFWIEVQEPKQVKYAKIKPFKIAACCSYYNYYT